MANGTGSLGLGVEDGLGETSSPLPSAAPVDEVPGATAFPLPPAAPVDEVPGATAFPLPPAAPVDEVPGATAFPLPSAAPVDEGLGATAAPLRSAAPASPLRPAAPAPAPGVPPTPDGSAGRHGLPGSRTDSVANGGDSGSQARGVGVFEGLGATSSPPRLAAPPSRVPLAPDASGRGAGGGVRDICNEFVERLVAGGLLDPGAIDVRLRTLLEEHFVRFLEESVANGGDSVPGAQGVGVSKGLGATSSPPRSAAPPSHVPLAPDASGRGAGGGVRDSCNEVVERLVAGGRLDPGAIDVQLRTLLEEHFVRFLEERCVLVFQRSCAHSDFRMEIVKGYNYHNIDVCLIGGLVQAKQEDVVALGDFRISRRGNDLRSSKKRR
nr:translation initiation factor IF-2 isoform X3 [Aegilops tauschii subsp. strangulata]